MPFFLQGKLMNNHSALVRQSIPGVKQKKLKHFFQKNNIDNFK